jgi:hypothetical protein
VHYTHLLVEQRGYHLSQISFEACFSDRYEAYINESGSFVIAQLVPGFYRTWSKLLFLWNLSTATDSLPLDKLPEIAVGTMMFLIRLKGESARRLLTAKELAKKLDVNIDTIRRGYGKREIPFERLCRPDLFDLKKVRSAMRLTWFSSVGKRIEQRRNRRRAAEKRLRRR